MYLIKYLTLNPTASGNPSIVRTQQLMHGALSWIVWGAIKQLGLQTTDHILDLLSAQPLFQMSVCSAAA